MRSSIAGLVLPLFTCAALVACSGGDGGRKPGPTPAPAPSGSGGAGGSAGTGGAGGGPQGGPGGAPADAAPEPAPTPTPPPPGEDAAPAPSDGGPSAPAGDAPCPKCVRIFNGTNFDGWLASTATWKIIDGAMHGQGGKSRIAYTKEDYGNVRLVFETRMNPMNGDHLGILFWGNRPMDPEQPQVDNAGWLQFMPNYADLWDYHPPKDRGIRTMHLGPNPGDWTKWHRCELLLTLDKGTVRVAADGVEVSRYTYPFPTERTDPTKRIIPGPIGMMKHGGGGSEYRNIWVEANPTEDKLYTVK